MKNGRSPEQRRYQACFERGEWVSRGVQLRPVAESEKGSVCVMNTDNVLRWSLRACRLGQSGSPRSGKRTDSLVKVENSHAVPLVAS